MLDAVAKSQVTLAKIGSTQKTILDTPLSVVGCILLFVFLLLEDPLDQVIPGLNYFDETIFIVSFSCACLALWHRHERLGKFLPAVLLLSVSVVCVGFLGNCFYSYQRNVIAIASEAIAYLKFPLTFIAFTVLLRGVDRGMVIDGCAWLSKLFIIVCCVGALINFVLPTAGFGHDVRNGFMSFKFIFSHPTFLVLSLVMAFVMMTAQDRSISVWKIVCLAVMAMTMRDKAFGFIALVLFLWLFNIGKKKRILVYVLLGCVLVLFVAWPKIALYLSYSNSPREALYTVGFQIASSSFPIGGGLGSFASSLSGRFYSDAYFVYGLSNMIGMTPTNFLGFGDAGIPYYYSQFGFLGFCLTALAFYLIYRHLASSLPFGGSRKEAVLALFGYLLIAVTVEAVFTNGSGLIAAILLAILVGDNANEHACG